MNGEFGFVYMMYRQKEDAKPVYVGFTTNPWMRLSSHFSGDEYKHNGKLRKETYTQVNYVKLASVGSENMARALEAKLIQEYLPEYNTAMPETFYLRQAGAVDESKMHWVLFSKEDFTNDKTIVFRCLADRDEIIKLREENERLKKEVTNGDRYEKQAEYWQEMYRKKSVECSDNWGMYMQTSKLHLEMCRLCSVYKASYEHLPWIAKKKFERMYSFYADFFKIPNHGFMVSQ